ncbi:DUF397 domain-containing protein [Nocardiopsis dassonvillei]|uniref:DUF397 domain-containing protein n=1 Tax=Nocardiopsis dassonvillei TaxID=2014 RepID=UPI00200E58D8|nr:DUF397 domain-containing protein [Nocardiopsis dassonvillei]MCK9870616.1 DUF397 domain-containing protein [Nocardiopsis dassonvillei]
MEPDTLHWSESSHSGFEGLRLEAASARPSWFKSSRSSAESHHCVEVAFEHTGNSVRVRDSSAPRAGNLVVSRGEWSVLVRSLGADAVEE